MKFLGWCHIFALLFFAMVSTVCSRADASDFGDPGLITDFRSGEYKEYLERIKTQIYRNLKDPALPKEVSIRFFLTKAGMVRDVSVFRSSGITAIDNHCVDAAYCASPLPAPPDSRLVLRPPSIPITPDYFGEGVYFFNFEKHEIKRLPEEDQSYFKIPIEIAYRYPKLFTLNELKTKSNLIQIDHVTPQKLEQLRFAWWTLFETPNVDRDKVIQLADKLASKVGENDRKAAARELLPP